jgi:fatty acid desaturase
VAIGFVPIGFFNGDKVSVPKSRVWVMKTLVAIVLVPIIVFAAVLMAAYTLIASIPSWLLVIGIGYLLWRRGRDRRVNRQPMNRRDPPAVTPGPWLQQAPAAPTVIYLVSSPSAPRPTTVDPPERWILP